MWLHKEGYFTDTLARLQEEGFAVKDFKVAGETCWLIFPPHTGIEWNEDNLIYRSSVWNSQGYPISLSWKKFFNWDERCDLEPKPASLDGCELIDKIDGSTLLASMYKGQLILRTRGSTDISALDNGFEREAILYKYRDFFDKFTMLESTDCTFVFEWTTPSNKIVLDYGSELQLFLTGIINHKDYSYINQSILDQCAEFFGFNRSKTYKFDTLNDLQKAMKDLKGIEGICVYFDNGQRIKKVKTDEYLMLHSVKFKLGYKALIDMIYEENVKLEEFKKRIEERFDHEALTFVENLINEIYEADGYLKARIEWYYEQCIDKLDNVLFESEEDLNERKAFADVVFNQIRCGEYGGFMFKMFDIGRHVGVRQVLMSHESLCVKFKKMVLEIVTGE